MKPSDLDELRRKADLSNKELARDLGVHRVHLSYVMHGRRESADLVQRATALLSARIARKK